MPHLKLSVFLNCKTARKELLKLTKKCRHHHCYVRGPVKSHTVIKFHGSYTKHLKSSYLILSPTSIIHTPDLNLGCESRPLKSFRFQSSVRLATMPSMNYDSTISVRGLKVTLWLSILRRKKEITSGLASLSNLSNLSLQALGKWWALAL